MTEQLLHFIWRCQYFNQAQLTTAKGEALQVIHPGQYNQGQGPDFLQARIRISNTLLAGSIELHLRTSDWNRHSHSGDDNYRNVILHVVYEDDGTPDHLPVLELQPRIPTLLLEQYRLLMGAASFIPCGKALGQLSPLLHTNLMERMLAERLHRKALPILEGLRTNRHSWEEGIWHLLARSFGGKTNGAAFAAIARSLPWKIMVRHSHSIHQLEALLMGQARLLQHSYEDGYARMLQQEYRFLQHKLGLQPINEPVHFLRMRPQGFPTLRLAQLASFVQQSGQVITSILDNNTTAISTLFTVTANDYWHYHYRFDEPAPFQPKRTGQTLVQNILINTVAPALFAYGVYHKQHQYTEQATALLETLPAEQNRVTREYASLGMKTVSAAGSQALLELHEQYCQPRKCLACIAGNSILKRQGLSAPASSPT